MKILFADIETEPSQAFVWNVWDQNIPKEMIIKDWTILSWAAKWQGKKRILYEDVQQQSEKKMLEGIWKLLDETDILVTQNGVRFDAKKLNARFIYHGMGPPSSYRHIDTMKLAKKYFGFTFNSLAYLAKYLKTKHQKLEHKRFPGFELWLACIANVKAAWKEMETYNKFDVIVLEEVYDKLVIWDPAFRTPERCTCGSTNFRKIGFSASASGRNYQRYRCNECGGEVKDRKCIK
jgi:hypothetical protein